MPAAADDKNINNPNDNAFDQFSQREIDTMTVYLTAKASRTAISIEEYINTRLMQGASQESIESDLLDDLNNNGRMFAEFRNAVRATSNGVIARSRDNALFSEVGVDEQYRWIAVLINSCPDCIERHGTSLTYAEWESAGLPRTGATVCREYCQCMLLPAKTAILDPIMRNRK